jgi:hypothetical protein
MKEGRSSNDLGRLWSGAGWGGGGLWSGAGWGGGFCDRLNFGGGGGVVLANVRLNNVKSEDSTNHGWSLIYMCFFQTMKKSPPPVS